MPPRIEACIVNHNTSPFAELALRSLRAMHAAPHAPAELRITLVDNQSTDKGIDQLEAAARELGVSFERSPWPAGVSWVNSHGDVLRGFTRTHLSADYFLFVDSDIVFDTQGCVWTMLREIAAAPDVWAVQARFRWFEEHAGVGSSLDIWAGQEQTWWVGMQQRAEYGDYPIRGRSKERCHPACALIANSPLFSSVSDIVGLSGAVVLSQDPQVAGHHDTLGLASQALKAYGLRYVLSDTAVVHYGNVSYEGDRDAAASKLADCQRRLAPLRLGTVAPVPPGPWG